MFDLTGRVAVITGGAGLLGTKHAEAIAELGGIPIIVDIDQSHCDQVADQIRNEFGVGCIGVRTDITNPKHVVELRERILAGMGRIDILINNAANNPTVGSDGLDQVHSSRLEALPLD